MRRWPSITGRGAPAFSRLKAAGSLPAVLFLLALTALWEGAARILNVPEYILPAPSAILQALLANRALLVGHARTTVTAALAGLLLAVAVALLLAVPMNRFRLAKQVLFPPLVISQTVPIIALAPLMLIWFGFGLLPKVLVVTLVCFFPVAVNLVEGLDNVDPELLDLLRTMEAGPLFILRHVQIPAVLPYFFSGLRIAATYSIMGAVIMEWLGAKAGLGIYMTRAMQSFSTAGLFAAIAVVVLLSLALFKTVDLLARLSMPWNRLNKYLDDGA